jgi:YVTN family beta-propeller protein
VVAIGSTAGAMTVGDGGIWVADGDAHTVARISVAHNRVNSVVTVPGVPSQIAASMDALWVTDGAAGTAAVLDGPAGRVSTIRVGGQPTGVAAAGNTVWVANTADGTLSRIDARRHVVVATVRVGVRPYALAADRQGVWVAVLGRPAMHVPSGPALKIPLAWLERLCGLG